MSKLIKVLMLSIVLVLTLTLAACGDKISDELNEDKTTLVLSDNLSSIVDNISLPMEGKNGGKITWSSSNTDVVTIEEVKVDDVVTGYLGKVTRPAIGAGDVTLKLTATIKLDGGKLTKVFEIRVRELPVPVGGNVEGVLAQPKDTQVTLNDVVVFAIIGDGYYVYDSTGFMFIFTSSAPADTVVVGDKINVNGEYTIYYNQPEITNPTGYTVVSSNNPLPTPTVTTIADITDYDTATKSIYATYLTVEGTVTLKGEYDNVFIVDDAGNELEINYKSNVSILEDMENDKIKLNVILHTYRTDSEAWRMSFVGTATDIVEIPVTDQEAATVAKNLLTLPETTFTDLILESAFRNVSITWESSDETIITDAGVIGDLTTDATVTMTATLTSGTVTETKTFEVTVLVQALSVTDALENDNGQEVTLTGIVSGLDSNGYFIQDADGTAIYVNVKHAVEVGDEVIVKGILSTSNTQRHIKSPTLEEIVSYYNAVYVKTDLTIDEVVTNHPIYSSYLITLSDVEIDQVDDGYGYMFLKTAGTVVLKFKPADFNIDTTSMTAGDVIDFISFNVLDINYSNIRVVNVTLGAVVQPIEPTDQEKLDAAETVTTIEDKENVTENLVLPGFFRGVDITWESDTEAVITGAGVIVRPAIGEADVTVTLTATFTIGTLTPVTKEIEVTVKALQPEPDFTETFDNSTATGSYGNGSFTGVNGVAWTFTGARNDGGYPVDGNGIMLPKNANIIGTITNGLTSFSLDYTKAFTGGTARTLVITLTDADGKIETFTTDAFGGFSGADDTVFTYSSDDLVLNGAVTVKIESPSSSAQIVIDNFSWFE